MTKVFIDGAELQCPDPFQEEDVRVLSCCVDEIRESCRERGIWLLEPRQMGREEVRILVRESGFVQMMIPYSTASKMFKRNIISPEGRHEIRRRSGEW